MALYLPQEMESLLVLLGSFAHVAGSTVGDFPGKALHLPQEM